MADGCYGTLLRVFDQLLESIGRLGLLDEALGRTAIAFIEIWPDEMVSLLRGLPTIDEIAFGIDAGCIEGSHVMDVFSGNALKRCGRDVIV